LQKIKEKLENALEKHQDCTYFSFSFFFFLFEVDNCDGWKEAGLMYRCVYHLLSNCAPLGCRGIELKRLPYLPRKKQQ